MEALIFTAVIITVSIVLVSIAKRTRMPLYILYALVYTFSAIMMVTIGSVVSEIMSDSGMFWILGSFALLGLFVAVACICLKRVILIPVGRTANTVFDPFYTVNEPIYSLQNLDEVIKNALHKGAYKLLISIDKLSPEFFDTQTEFSRKAFQKFAHYKLKIAIIGGEDVESNSSLKDFQSAVNGKVQVVFSPTEEDAKKLL